MDSQNEDEPCLVNAGQGSRGLNTVFYKKRFLYSKYAPERSVLRLVEEKSFLPGTLVLVFSPVLWYGLKSLAEKLPENCPVLAFEADKKLLTLAEKTLLQNEPFFAKPELFYAHDFSLIDSRLRTLTRHGKIKRVVRLDFSAGVQFESEVYEKIYSAAAEIVERFWKNRITLVKFSRIFFKNFFRNIPRIPYGTFLSDVSHSVRKPIIVCGAGESLDKTFADFSFANRSDFFILCVDAALSSLCARGILPDAVVGVEAQFAIQTAYVGACKKNITLFADIFSRSRIPDILGGKVVWFLSDVCDCDFLSRVKELGVVESVVPALGSVGLYAVYIALSLRASSEVPVFVTGLDFCYSVGKTHANNSPAFNARLRSSGRFFPLENYDAAFSPGTEDLLSVSQEKYRTTKALSAYGLQFVTFFGKTKNLFDSGSGGFPLSLERKNPISKNENSLSSFESKKSFEEKLSMRSEKKDAVESFLFEEKNALEKLRSLLSMGEKSSFYEKGKSLEGEVREILICREYLYLHFPDGYALSMEASFLKRVRAEIDFFIKQMGA